MSIPPSTVLEKPYVFVSHDHRDAEIAQRFTTLINAASGSMIACSCSTDHSTRDGIPIGSEWHKWIREKIGSASDLVALLTVHSIESPWIHYEVGLAKGFGRPIHSVLIGIDNERIRSTPISDIENVNSEASLAKPSASLLLNTFPFPITQDDGADYEDNRADGLAA